MTIIGYREVFQINANGKRYFCETEEQKQVFARNHPDAKTETFKIELQTATANKYLNDPQNIAAFAEPPSTR